MQHRLKHLWKRTAALLLAAAVLASSRPTHAAGGTKPSKPNVVIILSDDQGYRDLSSYGAPALKTPNLDGLAGQGARLTSFYSAAPVCSPSRAGLLTGMIPSRTGVFTWIPEGRPDPMFLPDSATTLAEMFKTQGYATCHVGKWHVSHLDRSQDPSGQPQPTDQGFDYSFGTHNNALPSHENPRNFIRNGEAVGPLEGYACDFVVDEAIDWLKARPQPKDPFFLYVAFNEPHENVAAPPEMVARFADVKVGGLNSDDPSRVERAQKLRDRLATYYATIENMDQAVGRLLTYLDTSGLADDTLVFFFSDNGSRKEMSYAGGTNLPLREYKGRVYDGGIRVPAILCWPGHVKPGTVYDQAIWAPDLYPTLADIVGQTPAARPAFDGESFLPLIEGKAWTREAPMLWFSPGPGPSVALREGDWALIGVLEKTGENLGKGPSPERRAYIKSAPFVGFELYNLRDDVSQEHNLADEHPDRVKAMSATMKSLLSEVTQDL